MTISSWRFPDKDEGEIVIGPCPHLSVAPQPIASCDSAFGQGGSTANLGGDERYYGMGLNGRSELFFFSETCKDDVSLRRTPR